MAQPQANANPPPMADLAPPPQPQGAGIPGTATFQALFADPARDPCHGNYERVMQRFRADGGTVVDGATLFRQVALNSRPVLQAYLACVATARGPRIYCVHSPATFTAALDGTETPWDDETFAFLGEPVQGMTTMVNLPETCFNVVNGWAKTAEQLWGI